MQLLSLLREPARTSRVRIGRDHVKPALQWATLKPGDDYFRLTVTHVFVRSLHLLLRQYVPVVYGSVRFQSGTQRRSISQVLDPRKDMHGQRGGSLVVNQHVIRSSPFVDPVLDLALGLVRVRSGDHGAAAVKLLTSVSAAVQPSIVLGVKLAENLTQGLSDLIEERESLVLGISETFDEVNRLEPGYTIPASDPDVRPDCFWMHNGILLYGEEEETAIPFDTADYLVYRVDGVRARSDYLSIDGVSSCYERALHSIQDSNAEALSQAYKTLLGVVAGSPEFTVPDAKRIATKLADELQSRWSLRKTETIIWRAGDRLIDAPAPDVTEEQYRQAVQWGPK